MFQSKDTIKKYCKDKEKMKRPSVARDANAKRAKDSVCFERL